MSTTATLLSEIAARPLDRATARLLMAGILRGEASESNLTTMLRSLNQRGETAAELAGFVEAMRAAAITLPLDESERTYLIDTCGTGGDAITSKAARGTFNISTAVALVAAAAGAKVAKHGNRSVTSQSGSADVLEKLGLAIDLSPEDSVRNLRATSFMYMHAPALHPAMKHVMPVRRALAAEGHRTVFNILGPLTNPAGARRQVMGVYAARLVPLVGEALALLGADHALVVHGSDGLDELTITGPSEVAEVLGHAMTLKRITPADAGLPAATLESIQGGTADENANILRSIFAGEPGPRRNIVLLNAAAVLLTAGHAKTVADGAKQAAAAIDSGAVTELLQRLQR